MRSDDARIKQLELIEQAARKLRESITIGGRSGPRLLLARRNLILWAGDELSPGGGGSGSGVSRPTEAKVFSEQSRASAIEAARKLAELDGAVDAVEYSLARAASLVESNTRSAHHAPNNLRGCRQCATVKGDDGRVHPLSYQPIAFKATELCEFCHRWQYGYGESRPGYGVPPHPDILRWHLEHPGSTPPRAVVRDLMPQAFEAREQAKKMAGKTCTLRKVTHLGVDHHCVLAPGHEPPCSFPNLPLHVVQSLPVAQ